MVCVKSCGSRVFRGMMLRVLDNPLPTVQGAQRVVAHDGVVTGACIYQHCWSALARCHVTNAEPLKLIAC
jgi:hypothetical protein